MQAVFFTRIVILRAERRTTKCIFPKSLSEIICFLLIIQQTYGKNFIFSSSIYIPAYKAKRLEGHTKLTFFHVDFPWLSHFQLYRFEEEILTFSIYRKV